MDDEITLVMVKGIMATLVLTFARHPMLLESQHSSSHLRPYTHQEAMDAVDRMFDRAKVETEKVGRKK